ncbi:MAG: hypothetical protein K2N05_11035 [Muribaculaceae bacterium]|nr:hypothetical protein [Muribaculaceae bacterium]
MAKNRNFDLNKGGDNKFDLHKGPNRKFDLQKDMDDEDEVAVAAEEAASTEEPRPVIPPAQTPQPEEPASVLEPEVTPQRVADAIEYGPEEPKKKGFAWLWALIGIAIVLAVLGMIFLRDGNKEEQAEEPVETVAEGMPGDSAVSDEAEAPTPEAENNAEAAPAAATAESTPVAAPAAPTASEPVAAAPATPKASAVDLSAQPTGSVKEEAKNVIKGIYGDGSERKNRLGDRYKEIQRRVNKMKRSGKF